MSMQHDNTQWQLDAQRKPSVTRPCPVCPESSGVFPGTQNDVKCPACSRTGKVYFKPGDRVATAFLEFASKIDPKLSANNRRRYHVGIVCKAGIPANSPPEYAALTASASVYVWAYSSERAMVAARDAAIWDGIPRPFEITVSRSFLVEDEVIQRTRSTCDEDKGLSE